MHLYISKILRGYNQGVSKCSTTSHEERNVHTIETTKIIPEYPRIIFLLQKDYNMLMTIIAYIRNSFIVRPNTQETVTKPAQVYSTCVFFFFWGGGWVAEGQKEGESTNSYSKEGAVKGQCLIFSSFTTYI